MTLKSASKEDTLRIAEEARVIARSVTTSTNTRMNVFEKEARAYAVKRTRETNPLLDKIIRIIR